MKKLILTATLAFFSASAFAADETIVVNPGNTHNWVFGNDGHLAPSTGAFVNGPGTPPAGTGSAEMSVIATPTATSSAERSGHVLGTAQYLGTLLSNFTQLKYWTHSDSTPQAIALQFDVVVPGAGYQRVVHEGYINGTVIPGTWQEWNVMAGKVWGSGSPGPTRPITTACPQSNPCDWSYVVAAFPTAYVSGATLFKAGSGWPNVTGSVDKLTVGVGGDNTTWDFELYSVPTNVDQCKDGGWSSFNPPGGPYKNQGACVAAVVSQSANH